MKTASSLGYKSLILFSLPSILAIAMEPLAGFVDTAFVGHVNTNWLAALAIATTIFNSFTWMFNFLIHASTQAVTTLDLEKDHTALVGQIKLSLFVALGVGFVSALVLFLARLPLYNLMGTESSLVPHVDAYFVTRVWAQPLTLMTLCCISLLRGLKHVRLCFWVVLVITLTNIIVSAILLFIFDLGLFGVAMGTVFGQMVGLLFSFIKLMNITRSWKQLIVVKIKHENKLTFRANSFNLFMRSLTLSMAFFISTRVASHFGVKVLAGHQILLQIWLIVSYIVDGLAVTAHIKAAEVMKLKSAVGLKILTRNLAVICFGVGCVFSMFYFVAPSYITGLFTNDVELISMLKPLVILVGFYQLFSPLAYLYDGLLFGTDDFAFLRKHMLIGVFILLLPFLFTTYYRSWGLFGIWIGFGFLNIYRVLSGALQVRRRYTGLVG